MSDLFEGRPVHSWTWFVEILRWVDGDTVDVVMDRGFGDRSERRLRLLGVNTPETNRRATRLAGLDAKARVIALAPPGSKVVARTYKHEVGNFGRYLVEVWPADEGEARSINRILLDEGHAVEYRR